MRTESLTTHQAPLSELSDDESNAPVGITFLLLAVDSSLLDGGNEITNHSMNADESGVASSGNA